MAPVTNVQAVNLRFIDHRRFVLHSACRCHFARGGSCIDDRGCVNRLWFRPGISSERDSVRGCSRVCVDVHLALHQEKVVPAGCDLREQPGSFHCGGDSRDPLRGFRVELTGGFFPVPGFRVSCPLRNPPIQFLEQRIRVGFTVQRNGNGRCVKRL